MKESDKYYLSSGNYQIVFDAGDIQMKVLYKGENCIEEYGLVNDCINISADYCVQNVRYSNVSLNKYIDYMRMLEAVCINKDDPGKTLIIKIWIGPDGVKTEYESEDKYYFKGKIIWGKNPEKNTFAVNISQDNEYLRAADGPASNRNDNALYDRMTDRVLEFGEKGQVSLKYDYNIESYVFESTAEKVELSVIQDFYKKQYGAVAQVI